MAVPAGWADFIAGFGNNDPYWFFPKRSVGNVDLPKIVAVYAEFDGKPFDQKAILKRLRASGLTDGKETAQIRVLRKGLENLGFCWLDGTLLRVTATARAYVEGSNRSEVVERHLWRYYLANPINPTANGLTLFPHRFLIELLLSINAWLSHDEFALFVARARTDADMPATTAAILNWRKLSSAQQQAIKNALPHRHDTIDQNAGYSMAFHRMASYFDVGFVVDGKDGLRLKKSARQALGKRVADHHKTAVPIIYRKIEECIADYGDVEQISDIEDRLNYHLDRSEPALAVEAFKKLPVALRKGRTVEEFKEEVFLEKHLEDFLFANPDAIEPGLKEVRRQHVIESGIVDLIAKDASGNIVVIELKKTRASDKVFGQLARYMGCMKQVYAKDGQKVRGYIIGSEITDKLIYAAQIAPKGTVRLRRFRRDPNSQAIFIAD